MNNVKIVLFISIQLKMNTLYLITKVNRLMANIALFLEIYIKAFGFFIFFLFYTLKSLQIILFLKNNVFTIFIVIYIFL